MCPAPYLSVSLTIAVRKLAGRDTLHASVIYIATCCPGLYHTANLCRMMVRLLQAEDDKKAEAKTQEDKPSAKKAGAWGGLP